MIAIPPTSAIILSLTSCGSDLRRVTGPSGIGFDFQISTMSFMSTMPASAAAREYLAEHEPRHYSMLHTSISPNIISGGFQYVGEHLQRELGIDHVHVHFGTNGVVDLRVGIEIRLDPEPDGGDSGTERDLLVDEQRDQALRG